MEPIPEAQLYAPQHGEVIEAAGLQFTAWYTPGHAVHHIAWQVSGEGEQVIFTGDVAGVKIGNGPVVAPCPPPDINIEDWQVSLRLLRELPVQTLYLTHFGIVRDKDNLLNSLEKQLLAVALWMKPHAEAQTPQEEIVPLFKEYVKNSLLAAGADAAALQRYEAANPAFMSVAGLMRYWKKKNQSAG
jgi:glyoxylase-like metal-dependent hydrolase (beta-lactamase superfamily II)